MTDEPKYNQERYPSGSRNQGSAETLTVDDFAAEDEVTVVEHVIANAPPETAYPALRRLDLLAVHSPITSLATWVRDFPDRLQKRLPPRVPTRLTFDDRVARGEWTLLSEQPGYEVIFGAMGTFWMPVVRWYRLTSRDEFLHFDKPRRCRVVLAFSVREYGRERSLLSYDIRTVVRDPGTRRIFRLYWKTVTPFVRHIMRDTLRTAAAHARDSRFTRNQPED